MHAQAEAREADAAERALEQQARSDRLARDFRNQVTKSREQGAAGRTMQLRMEMEATDRVRPFRGGVHCLHLAFLAAATEAAAAAAKVSGNAVGKPAGKWLASLPLAPSARVA